MTRRLVRGFSVSLQPLLRLQARHEVGVVLLEQGLVDKVVLFVYPVLLGKGKRLFSDGANPRELALVSTKVASPGVLMNMYRHVGSLRIESVADA